MPWTKSGAGVRQNFLSRKIKIVGLGQSQPNIMWSGTLVRGIIFDKIKNSGVLGHLEVWGNISHKKRIKIFGSRGTLHYNNVFQGTLGTEPFQR